MIICPQMFMPPSKLKAYVMSKSNEVATPLTHQTEYSEKNSDLSTMEDGYSLFEFTIGRSSRMKLSVPGFGRSKAERHMNASALLGQLREKIPQLQEEIENK